MTRSRFLIAATLAAVGLSIAVSQKASAGFDIYWLPAGSSGWNSSANWSYSPGGTVRPEGAPWAEFEEIGVINNGGTATLSAAGIHDIGGLSLGQAAADSGTLTISSGGVLNSVVTGSTTGAAAVGVGGTGTLNVSGTGSFSATGLTVAGQAASQATFSGNAAVSIGGSSTISRNLRITGPNVNFNSTTGVTFQGTSVLTHEITSVSAHSPVKSAGTVGLGGNLAVQFTGVTPTAGNSWNLVDAAAITGNFANAATGGAIQVTGAPAPAIGSAYRLRQTAGGTNGQLLQVALDTMLVLRVNRDTGELSIRNPLGAPVTQLDGYTISSPSIGSLQTSYKGISGAPVGNAGWEKAPGNSANALAEFKPTGSFNVSTAGTAVSLGTGFNKTAVASKGLGVNGEDLLFSYHGTGGAVVSGQIEYVGTPFLNNIALIVNTTTGIASLKNDTLTSLSLDGYSILSSTGALNGATWTSLADRAGTYPNWQESPTTTSALSETNSVAPMAIPAGQSITLGNIGNFATQAAKDGLSMKFILGSEATFRFATVSFTSGTGPAGDYDGNGRVDGADFLVWQRGGSPNPLSAGDLATWKSNFGATSAVGAAAAVPEPAACLMASVAAIAFVARRRGQR